MELDISAVEDDAAGSFELSTTTVTGSIDSTIVVGASLSNAISDILYIEESFMMAVIVFDPDGYADGVSVSVYDMGMLYEGGGTTDVSGFVSLDAPPDGYVVISKTGYITQKHRYTTLDSYVLLQVSLVPIVSVIHTPRGHFVSANPQDGANNIFL